MTPTAKLLAAVETIRPILTEDASKAEAERVPTFAGYQAMYDAGLFAMLAPRRTADTNCTLPSACGFGRQSHSLTRAPRGTSS